MSDAAIIVEHLVKDFPTQRAVDDVSLEVVDGELLAVLGPSGCGKTTILRMIAGLTLPTSGRIRSRGRDITMLPPNRRKFGMVFQNYALFPHMTVWDNVAYGLRMRRSRGLQEKVGSALTLVRLSAYAKSYPRQLSGGQQQRVALARALAISPDALLLDEPLSNLDLKLRTELRMELSELRRKMGWTTIFVTHDQTEALSMADRVAVMRDGVLQQMGTPSEIYQRPKNRFVASFVGEANILDGVVRNGHFEFDDGRYRMAPPSNGPRNGAAVISVRPEAVELQPLAEHQNGSPRGVVVTELYGGAIVRYLIELETGRRVVADRTAWSRPVSPGDTVSLTWKPESSICLEED